MASPFKNQVYPESEQRTTFSNLKASLAGLGVIALLSVPALFLSKFTLTLDRWETSALGAVAIFAAHLLAHVPAGVIWARVRRRDRAAFVLYVLAPALAGNVVAMMLAAWTLWPALVLIAISLDDIWTASLALGLPPGGEFDEARDGNAKRWIHARYPDGREEFYEPRL